MFSQSAQWYDLLYNFKNYEQEAETIRQYIRQRKPNAYSVLDVGCGTGEHHRYLKADFRIDGLDIQPDFIQIAQTKNPQGRYSVGDMKQFDLQCPASYDIVLCLFSSIGYLDSYDQIVAALRCFYQHLRPDGLAIVEPWFTKATWKDGSVHLRASESEGVKICRMNTSSTQGDYSILDFHYLLGQDHLPVQHFQEQHRLRMTDHADMLQAFADAGFAVTYEPNGLIGRGMYFGKRAAV